MLKLFISQKKLKKNEISKISEISEISKISEINKFNYVINLKRREDRWNNFIQKINQTSMKNLDFIKFEAFDASNYMNELEKINYKSSKYIKKLIDSFIKNKIKFIKCGEFGCLISHMLVLETIINNKDIGENDFVNIYEDDIEYCDNFETNYALLNKLNLNKLNMDFLYLGGRFSKNYNSIHSSLEKRVYNNLYFRKPNFKRTNLTDWDRCTFSYIVKKSCCTKILKNINNFYENNKRMLAIDHLYIYKMNNIEKYDFLPHLFYSSNNGSDIQTVKKVIQF